MQHVHHKIKDQQPDFTALSYGQKIPESNLRDVPTPSSPHINAYYASNTFHLPQRIQTMSGLGNSYSSFDPLAGAGIHYHSPLVSNSDFILPLSHDGTTTSSRYPASESTYIPTHNGNLHTLGAAGNSNFVGDPLDRGADPRHLTHVGFSSGVQPTPRVDDGSAPNARHQAFYTRLIQTISEQNIDLHTIIDSMVTSGRLDVSRLRKTLSRYEGMNSPVSNRRRRRVIPRKGRVCLQCGTDETPQWRKHPQTGAVLCNSCGQKAYRAQNSLSR
ncbi:hypothetical protein R3P38DRAFT_2775528 [Favolaschia claudopus]|uniref:GATA-type domain-containing protein n=1 Tax=Favolaschia claudopus TaxID=2862362 RepID=A0AAW0BTN0_9AGAR